MPYRIVLLLVCSLQPGLALCQTQGSSGLLGQIGIDQKLDAQVPLDLKFRDERGRTVRLGEYLVDKPVILNLVYFECPMLCNMTMDGLVRALRGLEFNAAQEFVVVTVSFDPRETPALASKAKNTIMKRYGRQGAQQGWHFLTGDKVAIEKLTQTVGFRYAYDPRLDQFAHAAGLVVLTPQGRISRYLHGIEFNVRDLRLSLVEASAGEIGSATDQVLLMCYRYDPATGRYGLVIQNVIRVFGLATLTAILGSVLVMLRNERRAKRMTNPLDKTARHNETRVLPQPPANP